MLMVRSFRTICVCLLLLYSCNTAALGSQQYDARLCSAQLLVLKGDLRQFLNQSTSAQHKEGYEQRIAGTLGTLNWLCRQYASFYELSNNETPLKINGLRTAITTRDWGKANQLLNSLIKHMPLSLKGFRPESADASAIKVGKEIYKGYCMACHQQPALNQTRPAYSLFNMAKQLSPKEFIGRMIIGVHGTSDIALQNPLTDEDIAGMFAYFLKETNEK